MRAIRDAVQYRGGTLPQLARPLCAPFMAHETYSANLRRLMREYIRAEIHSTVPFHVPKTTVVFGRHRRVSETIFNFRKHTEDWAKGTDPACQCCLLRKYAPDSDVFDGYIVAKGSDLRHHLQPMQLQILQGSTKNTFFPAKHIMRKTFMMCFQRWARNNSLPTTFVNLDKLFEEEWRAHSAATQDVFTFHDLQKIRQLLGDCVWHIEDHCSTAFRAYCPVIYHRALQGTFCTSSAFEAVPTSITALYHDFYYYARKLFKSRYAWAFPPDFIVPQAYKLPKRKKGFLSGRPIVSFIQACGRGLLEATVF
jgi:hypothetical protein